MKITLMTIVFAFLSGCTTHHSYEMRKGTAPGAALPGFIAVCNERDDYGRCKEWSSKSELCNPINGYGEPIPCSQIENAPKPQYEF